MAFPAEKLDALEQILNKIATEMILAESGSTEGMVPIYSLLSDLIDMVEDHPILQESASNVREALDSLLDSASAFDGKTLDYLSEFSGWAQAAVFGLRADKEIEIFAKLEGIDFFGEVADSSESQEVEASMDDEVSEMAKTTDVLMSFDLEEDGELLNEFHSEALDHLEQIEASLLVLERTPEDPDSMSALFRSFHTIKGVAGFLHLVPVNRLAHEVESLLDLARNKKLTLDSGMITLVLQSRDTISELVAQITDTLEKGKMPDKVIPVSHLIIQVKRAAEAGLRGEASTVSTQAAKEKSSENNKKKEAAQRASTASANPQMASATIRVNTSKLDNLMDMVGELVIVQSQIQESAKNKEQTGENTILQRNMGQLARITKELQKTSMALRMIPIKQTFQKVGRLVRDLAGSFGKKVDFVTVGEDTELDRNVVEQIGDPLVHMVRNSIDHGLEATTEDRVAAGKSESGTVALKAYHMGSNIVIELSDDGRGLDSDRIFQKACERGLIKPDQKLTPEEINQLIFLPGFSTAEKVTDVSGRGVGMDVVKRNIEKLRGAIEIESTKGKGTVFKVKLPLTMAIIDGLVVRCGEDKFILPTTSVKVAMHPEESQISTIKERAEILTLRGKTIPVVKLAQFLSIPCDSQKTTDGILVIIETLGRPYALLVDEMVSKQEVVIKSLGGLMQNLPGVAGGAILGDGAISLILDPSSIFSTAGV